MDSAAQPPAQDVPTSGQEIAASAAPGPRQERKRLKREPIVTLEVFFSRRAAKASGFLKDLREADRWDFEPDDVKAALETHAARDKDFGRTTQLVAAALKERDGRFARPTIAFAEAAIHHRLADNPHYIGADTDSPASASERFDLVARALRSRLRESKRRAESTNLLLATLLCASREGGIAPRDAIARLVSVLEIEPSRSGDRAVLTWLGEKPKDARSALELAAPWVRSARDLDDKVTDLQAKLDDETSSREEAEAEVVRLSTDVADLQKAMADARTQIEQLEERVRAVDVHADHDARRLKARLAGLLDAQLRDLVTTVEEALSIDPPRVEVAREKVDVILRELERQVSWLRS